MILCVDPDADALAATESALADAGFDTVGCGSLAAALERLDPATIDCLVTEYELPDGTGLDLISEVRETTPDVACVLFTDTPIEVMDTTAVGDAVAEYLPKDASGARSELVELVEHSLVFRSQTAYPVPENEDARLAALERYAADPASLGDSLGRLTELAAALFDLNSAAVGLIRAHEEEFISCHGATFDVMDREKSICTYTILEKEVTVIPDVRDDPRFNTDGRLEAADILFYAGAPVVTPDGEAIGVFCLHDDEPRSFSQRDRELLELFAEETMEQLELRRRLREATEGDVDV
jgi:GAF domain-containing protein